MVNIKDNNIFKSAVATILLSKESGFNFYFIQVFISLDGNLTFILYNNVIYRIYHNVTFK